MSQATQGPSWLSFHNFTPWNENPSLGSDFCPPPHPVVKIGDVVVNSQNRQRSPFIEERSGVAGKTWSHSGTVGYPQVGIAKLNECCGFIGYCWQLVLDFSSLRSPGVCYAVTLHQSKN